jgi:hypothetical protein
MFTELPIPPFASGNAEQERKCTYNLILRRVRVTIVAVEEQ